MYPYMKDVVFSFLYLKLKLNIALFRTSAGMTEDNQACWDRKTQTFHGGQDWRFCSKYIDDFSITTNGLGPPESAVGVT